MAVAITIDELMSEIRQCQEKPDQRRGLSVMEIADAIGKRETCTRRIVQRMVQSGRMEMVMERRECMDGRIRPVPVYRVKRAK